MIWYKAEADQRIANTLDQGIGKTRNELRADARDPRAMARAACVVILLMVFPLVELRDSNP